MVYSFQYNKGIKKKPKGWMEMPWERKTVEETRLEFVTRVLAHEKSKSALCREYGISRPTGDKWIARYLAGEDLSDHSRRPFHTPNRISEEMEAEIVAARKAEPAIGARKTRRIFLDEGKENVPSASTINRVFHRNGLITKEASEAAKHIVRFEKAEPNEMWQADFKGDFLLQDGKRCYPLSLIDDHSRMCLCADAKPNVQLHGTKESFRKAFETYGLPKTLLCDNGNPWGSSQSTSITKFEVWLMEHDVLTIHIRPVHPQTQGKVERFNGSYKQERLKFYVPKDMADAQKTREEYMHFYNCVRPHFALNLDHPSQHYRPSERKYTDDVPEWDYGHGAILAHVKSSGYFRFNGQGYFLSEGMGDKDVMLRPSATLKNVFRIVFRDFQIGSLNVENRMVISRKIYRLTDDPRNGKV